MDNSEKIIELQEKYINLLGEELEELVILAHNRGWKSTRIEEGKIMREEIKKLKDNE
jgi:hypothetical protein